jgi:hypothetical protein
MSFEIVFSVVCALLILGFFAFTIAYKQHPHDIDNVILLARPLDTSDLEDLFDAASKWELRRPVTKEVLREIRENRVRLAKEYLKRVVHNTNLIHLWVLQEHDRIRWKRREEYTHEDRLIQEALAFALKLRIYSIAVFAKLWLSMFLTPDFLGQERVSVPTLRLGAMIDVPATYGRLVELALELSCKYGIASHYRLRHALCGQEIAFSG